MHPQQTPITTTRLDDSVLPAQPASDWATSTESALGSTTNNNAAPSTSVPGESSHIVQPHETGLDMSAKPQSTFDQHVLGTESAVSTPGLQVPGAWNDKPTSATQVMNDAGNALATAGSAAYNALPASVKGVFSTQTTNDSAIQTTTNHSTTTPSQTASSHLSNLAEAGTAAGATVAGGAALAYEKASNALGSSSTGPTSTIDKSKPTTGLDEMASLPSQELHGQQPLSGPMGGAGALPGDMHQTGVAILPDDKDALANKSTMATEATAANTVQPTMTDRAMAAAAVAAATATTAAAVVADKANDVYQNPHEYVPAAAHPYLPGSTTSPSTAIMPAPSHEVTAHPTQSLPSQELEGQQPASGVMGGVGSLPGALTEEGVAVLPEEKEHPNPLATSEFAGANTNKSIASPYSSESPYSNTDANAIEQPKQPMKNKVEGKAEAVKEKVVPSHHDEKEKPPTIDTAKTTTSNNSSTFTPDSAASGSPTRKAGFMDKLKGQSKILSGKLSHNEEKIAQGQALKMGTEYSAQK